MGGSGRERAYVSKPSEALKARLAAAQQKRLFVVQTNGPTSFVLREEGERRKVRVSIGSVHSCSCGARDQPCVHVAFVMLRVFRLPTGDSRCWQASLIDRELEDLVDARARSVAARRLEEREWGAPPTGGAEGEESDAPRRPYASDDGADPCPICYEEIMEEDEGARARPRPRPGPRALAGAGAHTPRPAHPSACPPPAPPPRSAPPAVARCPDRAHARSLSLSDGAAAGALDWCKRACGKSVHRHCFAMWAEHQSSIGQKLTCPHCRAEWASDPLPTAQAHLRAAAGVRAHAHGRSASGASGASGGTGTGGGGGRGGASGSASGASGGPPAPPPSMHRDARCASCRCMPIVGTRYRCLACDKFELCGDCFASCMHPQHPFAARARPKGKWAVAPCRAVADGDGGEGRAGDEDAPHAQRADGGGGGRGGGGATGGGGGGGGDGDDASTLEAALAALQHREISPDDYDLLMALTQAAPDFALPRAAGSHSAVAAPVGAAGHGRAGRRSSATALVASAPPLSLVSRLVHYDAADVQPLVDEINAIEAHAIAAKRAAAEANAPPALLAGTAAPLMARPVGGDIPAHARARTRTSAPLAPFGSSAAARPWQQQRSAASLTAERLASDRIAAGRGQGYEALGLSGTAFTPALSPAAGALGAAEPAYGAVPPSSRESGGAAAAVGAPTPHAPPLQAPPLGAAGAAAWSQRGAGGAGPRTLSASVATAARRPLRRPTHPAPSSAQPRLGLGGAAQQLDPLPTGPHDPLAEGLQARPLLQAAVGGGAAGGGGPAAGGRTGGGGAGHAARAPLGHQARVAGRAPLRDRHEDGARAPPRDQLPHHGYDAGDAPVDVMDGLVQGTRLAGTRHRFG